MTPQITPGARPMPAPPTAATHELRTLGVLELRGPEGQVRTLLAQPRRLALLVYLASLPPGAAARRDTLLARFWPEHDEARARAALRQALRFLRTSLGPEVLVSSGDDAVAIAPGVLWHDLLAFEQAVAAGRLEEALELYRGDFLAGFFVAGAAPELEQWMDDTRGALRERAVRAAGALADAAARAGRTDDAVRWARRAVGVVPHDEAAHRRLVALLDAAGDTGGALEAYEALVRRLARDFDADPSPETRALAEAIRARRAAPPRPEPAMHPTPLPSRRARLSEELRLVAVLPFAWRGPDDERYLAGELAEEIREALRGAGGVVVASRQESEGVVAAPGDARDAGAIARRLGAAAVLDGTLEHDAGTLRLAARLVDGADGAELWRDTFAREARDLAGLRAVLDRLARATSGAMRIALAAGPAVPAVRRLTHDLEAYNLYLRGRFHWSRRPRETRQALDCFERALARDPLFALAHAGVADAYNTLGSWEASVLPSWEAFPRAHAAAMKALQLDPTLAEAHAALGYAQVHYRWDWAHAADELARACALGPGYAHAHHWRAHHLVATGRMAEAHEAGLRAHALEPLDGVLSVHMAWHHWMAREPGAAGEWCDRTQRADPHDHWARFFRGLTLAQQGEHGAAVAALREAVPLSGGSPVMSSALAWALAASGEARAGREARAMLRDLAAHAERERLLAYEVAVVHAALREADQAFDWLDRAYEERSAWLAYARVEPRLDGLRGDPRFAALLRALGTGPPTLTGE